jgi:protein TonB
VSKATVGSEQKATQPAEQGNEVFTVVEKMPEFPGGSEAMTTYLVGEIKYPAEAKTKGVQGTVYVSFVVEKDGAVSNVKVIRGIGAGCDEEAVRVVKMMPKWKPGTQKGQTVRCQFNVPLSFKLSNGKTK